jgi:hypothetical protein
MCNNYYSWSFISIFQLISSAHSDFDSGSGYLWPTISQLVEDNILSHDPMLCSMCMLYTWIQAVMSQVSWLITVITYYRSSSSSTKISSSSTSTKVSFVPLIETSLIVILWTTPFCCNILLLNLYISDVCSLIKLNV